MTFYEKPGGSPGYLIVILHLPLVTMETNASRKKKTAHWEKDHKRMEQEMAEPQESGNPLREEGKNRTNLRLLEEAFLFFRNLQQPQRTWQSLSFDSHCLLKWW
ncbi:hypothetical protein CDAR_561921 [Caerostris darwini]|uniref:Uncharacterized protein n=1 Tax=Caerostris darwini TaxID=1538125 RepID=A0AAV4SCT6_9ARAC|nr:hypothetical protein CDAR_561921 [Caerostris darwini]